MSTVLHYLKENRALPGSDIVCSVSCRKFNVPLLMLTVITLRAFRHLFRTRQQRLCRYHRTLDILQAYAAERLQRHHYRPPVAILNAFVGWAEVAARS
jgi:hypothetical protein